MNSLTPQPDRIALKKGVARYGDGTLILQRFGSGGRGGAFFIMRSEKPISALIELVPELEKVGVGGEPEFRSLGDDYVAYWVPPSKAKSGPPCWPVTLSHEPMGRPSDQTPFSIEMADLSRVAARIRDIRA